MQLKVDFKTGLIRILEPGLLPIFVTGTLLFENWSLNNHVKILKAANVNSLEAFNVNGSKIILYIVSTFKLNGHGSLCLATWRATVRVPATTTSGTATTSSSTATSSSAAATKTTLRKCPLCSSCPSSFDTFWMCSKVQNSFRERFLTYTTIEQTWTMHFVITF